MLFVAEGPGAVDTMEFWHAGHARESAISGDSSRRHCLRAC